MTSTPSPTVSDGHDAPAAESLRVKSDALAAKVTALIHEGTMQRIVVRDHEGHSVIEIPVTFGVAAAVLAPAVVAVGALAALAADWQVDVHREVHTRE